MKLRSSLGFLVASNPSSLSLAAPFVLDNVVNWPVVYWRISKVRNPPHRYGNQAS